jgi:hypothetical protein
MYLYIYFNVYDYIYTFISGNATRVRQKVQQPGKPGPPAYAGGLGRLPG